MRLLFMVLILHLGLSTYAQDLSKEVGDEMAFIESNLFPRTMVKGKEEAPRTLTQLMQEFNVPGISVAVIDDGELQWSKGYGMRDTKKELLVDGQTLFQAGSISKPLAALAALQLVEAGDLDLDTDINSYLKTWKLPSFDFEEKVTLRLLLTHSAGMSVHGFPGYADKDDFPSINDVLDGKGNTGKIYVDSAPGENWRYSGGGYTVMEKVVEDVSGMTLEKYMAENVFPKLGMTHSTYDQPLGSESRANVSLAYNRKGKIIDGSFHHYPEQAAAGLWTTPEDLAIYVTEMQEIFAGKEGGILSPRMVKEMFSKHKNNWGLGPSLREVDAGLLFGHGGKNAGFTNNMIATTIKGGGIIIMTNADQGSDVIDQLQLAISNYYDMGISSSELIEIRPISEDELERLKGEYVYDGDRKMVAKISVKKGKLNVKVGGNHELEYLGDLLFADLKDPQKIQFEEDDAGKINGFRLVGPEVVFKKTK